MIARAVLRVLAVLASEFSTTPARLLAALVVSASLAPSSPARAEEQEHVGSTEQPVVYGTDDRVEYYAIPTPAWQTIARQSIVALVPNGALDLGTPGLTLPPFADGTQTLDDYTYAEFGQGLCAGERFANQVSAAVCSGTLIDDDLVLTAGHCAHTLADCQNLSFVFDYYESSVDVLEPIDGNDVYSCAHVLAHSERASPHLDYAIVQLDRPVVGRVPAEIRMDRSPLPVGSGLVVIGFGSGLPLKFDDGGSVVNAHESTLDVFVGDTDTFGGNSGSGVFDDTGRVVGILVAGAEDYVLDGTCVVANVLGGAEAAEDSTYVFRAVDALCGGGFPSAVCPTNPAPSCGDGFCSGGEDAIVCADDCVGPRCGDDVCSAGETMDLCPYDCTGPKLRRSKGRCSIGLVGVGATGRDPDGVDPVVVATSLLVLGIGWARARRRGATRAVRAG